MICGYQSTTIKSLDPGVKGMFDYPRNVVHAVEHRNEYFLLKGNGHTMLVIIGGITFYLINLGEMDGLRSLYRKRLEVQDEKGKLVTLMHKNSY